MPVVRREARSWRACGASARSVAPADARSKVAVDDQVEHITDAGPQAVLVRHVVEQLRVGQQDAAAAETARAALIALVAEQRRAGRLPDGDPERLEALLQALAHGAVALTLVGHLSPGGKGYAGPGRPCR